MEGVTLDGPLPWMQGDDPRFHPLWARQFDLERQMSLTGADEYRDRVAKAASKKQMADLGPVRRLTNDLLPRVAKGLIAWKRDHRNSQHRPLALSYLEKVDPYVAALITLRAVLDGITVERTAVQTVATEVGRTIQHELQIRAWEGSKDKEDRAKLSNVHRMLKNDDATSGHRAKVLVNRFNKHIQEGDFGFGWEYWPEEVCFRVGVVLVEILRDYTGWFEITADPHGKRTGKRKLILTIAPTPGLLKILGDDIDREEKMATALQPTLMPPKRWDGTRKGGYYTPYVMTPRLIRFKASQENQKERAADEYEALDMPEMYDAIHRLQEVPWRVNHRVWDVAMTVWTMDLGIAGMPLKEAEELPIRSGGHEAYRVAAEKARITKAPTPVASKELEEEMRLWRKKAKRVNGRNAKKAATLRASKKCIEISSTFYNETFYFPQMLDFRGRIYPIPTYLQPQGSDLARGLLDFAEGKPVGATGGYWLAVSVANMWGNDKISLDDRVAWVKEHAADWRAIAADPLGVGLDVAIKGDTWATCGEPFQALAAIFDYVGALDEGDDYVSHRPCVVDGTCNGIQHLAAMCRDSEMGRYVNLVPADGPQDIYQEVANRTFAEVRRIASRKLAGMRLAKWWLERLDGNIPRKATKRQTMIVPYGGTLDSCFEHTMAWTNETWPMPDEAAREEWSERAKYVQFLSAQIWKQIGSIVERGQEVQKWLQDCAKCVLEGDQPIFWITPSGMVVRHFYGKLKEREVRIHLNGISTALNIPEYSKELDIQSQLRGIPPNFTHSIDASCLVTTINRCAEAGIGAFTAVHDAYGTHACDMWGLYDILREAFVDTHKHDVLGIFRDGCRRVLVDQLVAQGKDELDAVEKAELKLPRPLPMGDLDIEGVLTSDYFFA